MERKGVQLERVSEKKYYVVRCEEGMKMTLFVLSNCEKKQRKERKDKNKRVESNKSH